MWNWAHFKGEGWLAHSKRSIHLSGLLLLAGLAMLVHAVVPFWQQPKGLQSQCVSDTLRGALEKKQE